MKNEKGANPLTDVVDKIVSTLLPKATMNRSFFVNDIPDWFQLGENSENVTSVIGNLLSTAVHFAKESCIWLSAKLYGNVILVHVKCSNGFHCRTIEARIRNLQILAGRSGGAVGLTTWQNHVTSLTFGFSN